MLGDHVADQHVAAGHGRGHHKAARLDLVGDDGIGAAMHGLDTPDLDAVGAGAAHIRAHHVQEVGQVHDVGFLGHILQHGLALSQHGAEHGVHGSAHRHGVKEHMGALQPVALHMDTAVLHRVGRAQSGKGFQVLVDGAGAQVTAAGHGHLCRAEPAQQRPQEVIAGAHLPGQIVRHGGAADVGGVNFVAVFVEHPHPGAQRRQDAQRHQHVADGRQVFHNTNIGRQNGGRQDRNGGILGPADGYLAHQRLTALNHEFFQSANSPLRLPDVAGKGLPSVDWAGGRKPPVNCLIIHHFT